MLEFSKTDEYYIITQSILGFTSTKTMVVKYTKDLKTFIIDNNPPRDMLPTDIDWFEKHYRPKFDAL